MTQNRIEVSSVAPEANAFAVESMKQKFAMQPPWDLYLTLNRIEVSSVAPETNALAIYPMKQKLGM